MKKMNSLPFLIVMGCLMASSVCAQVSDNVVKIGVLNDQSGIYSDLSGPGSVEAVKMAVEDFGGKVLDKPIEVVFADHQNKPDIGANIANKWIDVEKVDMIIDLPTTSVCLAVQEICKNKNRIDIISTGASVILTNENCSPTGFHWAYDSYALARVRALPWLRTGAIRGSS